MTNASPSRLAWTRLGIATAVATMGAIDVLSALLSHPSERLHALRRLVPTEVLDTSRTFTLLAGVLLLFTAWGLRRGKRRAFVTALFLCAISVPVNLLKAVDIEEATVAAGLMFVLGLSAGAFRVRSHELSFARLGSRGLWLTIGLLVYGVAGCWWLEAVYGPDASFARAVAEAGHRLFGIGEPALRLPQELPLHGRRVIDWFLGSLPLTGLTLLVGLAVGALRPVAHRRRHRDETRAVAELLRAHGDSTVASFALAPDADYFFSGNRRALIAYRFESDTLLGIGDPIGPDDELAPLLAEFAADCAEHDWAFAFFQSRPERLPLYQSLGWRALHIGEDPILWTDRFSLEGSAMGDVRRSARKAEESGLVVRCFFPGETPFDPGAERELATSLAEVSDQWLNEHHGTEKGFCMGRYDPDTLGDAWLAVAWSSTARRVEAFVTWVPIWARRGWALDLMRRRSDAANGAMELLIARSVELARERGDALLSLSLSALASVDEPASADAAVEAAPAARPPADPERAREFLIEHLARFYDFKGLFRWKKKFAPAFEDRYLVYPSQGALPRVVLALVRAQSPGGLLSYLRNGQSR